MKEREYRWDSLVMHILCQTNGRAFCEDLKKDAEEITSKLNLCMWKGDRLSEALAFMRQINVLHVKECNGREKSDMLYFLNSYVAVTGGYDDPRKILDNVLEYTSPAFLLNTQVYSDSYPKHPLQDLFLRCEKLTSTYFSEIMSKKEYAKKTLEEIKKQYKKDVSKPEANKEISLFEETVRKTIELSNEVKEYVAKYCSKKYNGTNAKPLESFIRS